ncbi:hypothetical protein HY489_01515 [Candidatus Woesearchaeota archaeon]|nr:hypothetical protein [Candidatus Woesearchaeota archaeon]
MAVCENCHSFKVFGSKCWFFWEGKKTCSQFKRSSEDEPQFCSELVQIR